ncbi:probable glycosidase CRH1 [Glycine soja]|uniref:probable glycosidase CRH1 n=1 Tax=Glycine soja TaxID=3848 RepID=UPI00103AA251|nr:probable glycosidase CRH1 [Glycine soja]
MAVSEKCTIKVSATIAASFSVTATAGKIFSSANRISAGAGEFSAANSVTISTANSVSISTTFPFSANSTISAAIVNSPAFKRFSSSTLSVRATTVAAPVVSATSTKFSSSTTISSPSSTFSFASNCNSNSTFTWFPCYSAAGTNRFRAKPPFTTAISAVYPTETKRCSPEKRPSVHIT